MLLGEKIILFLIIWSTSGVISLLVIHLFIQKISTVINNTQYGYDNEKFEHIDNLEPKQLVTVWALGPAGTAIILGTGIVAICLKVFGREKIKMLHYQLEQSDIIISDFKKLDKHQSRIIKNMEKGCLADSKTITTLERQLDRQKRKTTEIYRKYENILDTFKGSRVKTKTFSTLTKRAKKIKSFHA